MLSKPRAAARWYCIRAQGSSLLSLRCPTSIPPRAYESRRSGMRTTPMPAPLRMRDHCSAKALSAVPGRTQTINQELPLARSTPLSAADSWIAHRMRSLNEGRSITSGDTGDI